MKISRTKKTKAYIPKTEEEKEQVRIKEFLDMCAPSVLKFYRSKSTRLNSSHSRLSRMPSSA